MMNLEFSKHQWGLNDPVPCPLLDPSADDLEVKNRPFSVSSNLVNTYLQGSAGLSRRLPRVSSSCLPLSA